MTKRRNYRALYHQSELEKLRLLRVMVQEHKRQVMVTKMLEKLYLHMYGEEYNGNSGMENTEQGIQREIT